MLNFTNWGDYEIPLLAEPMDMVSSQSFELKRKADADEGLGKNEDQVHSDIYINELLVGMCRINKALPAILKKLGIDEDSLQDSK